VILLAFYDIESPCIKTHSSSFVILSRSSSSSPLKITDRSLPAGSAAGSSAGIVFTHVPVLGFYAPPPLGRHVSPIKVKFCTEERTATPFQISPWSAQGWGFTAPKTEKKKNWNFTNIIAPKGRVPCTIFTKFTGFMRFLSLHNFAKFGCFISINDKIINNFLQWWLFQPNFRRPLAAKLWIRPKKVLT